MAVLQPHQRHGLRHCCGSQVSHLAVFSVTSYTHPGQASPHDAHLLATFSQDSNIVRVLDVRQPGQALLELKGHSSSINCVEWSPNRRGVLASGADDCFVLLWDLINQHNAVPVPPVVHNPGAPSTTSERGPAAAWQNDYEVSNISWSPQGGSTASGHPRDWLGVCGGRGIWGVAL